MICADAAGYAESQIALQRGPDKRCQALRGRQRSDQRNPLATLPTTVSPPVTGTQPSAPGRDAAKSRATPICAQSCCKREEFAPEETPRTHLPRSDQAVRRWWSHFAEKTKAQQGAKITAHPCCHAVSPARQLPWNRGRAFLRHRAGHPQIRNAYRALFEVRLPLFCPGMPDDCCFVQSQCRRGHDAEACQTRKRAKRELSKSILFHTRALADDELDLQQRPCRRQHQKPPSQRSAPCQRFRSGFLASVRA